MDVQYDIEAALRGIVETRNVAGAAVCAKDGTMILSKMPGFYDEYTINEVVNLLISTQATVADLGMRTNLSAYDFGDMRLMLKDLRKGYMVVLCEPHVQVALLNVAMRVTEKKISKILSAYVANGGQLPARPAAPPVAAPPAPAPETVVATSASADVEAETSKDGGQPEGEDWSAPVILFGQDG